MEGVQLEKLAYVSRHVDDLFNQRIQQFDSIFDAQVGWLQEFVKGKEANLKEQLEYESQIRFSRPSRLLIFHLPGVFSSPIIF